MAKAPKTETADEAAGKAKAAADKLKADNAARREFWMLLEAADLTQNDAAELLGTWPMTVSRWLSDRTYDTFPPPFHALNFLRAYVQLAPTARRQMPRLKLFRAKPVKVKPAPTPKAAKAKATAAAKPAASKAPAKPAAPKAKAAKL